MKNLTQKEWSKALSTNENAKILDVRTPVEVEAGKITSAPNIDNLKPHAVMAEIEKLNKTLHYFVYCKAGMRSAQACAVMHQLGFEYTYNLDGGFSEWMGAVEK